MRILLVGAGEAAIGIADVVTGALVRDGLTPDDVALAMRRGIEAVCAIGSAGGIQQVTAGNYGGKLGPHHFHLHEVLA